MNPSLYFESGHTMYSVSLTNCIKLEILCNIFKTFSSSWFSKTLVVQNTWSSVKCGFPMQLHNGGALCAITESEYLQ